MGMIGNIIKRASQAPKPHPMTLAQAGAKPTGDAAIPKMEALPGGKMPSPLVRGMPKIGAPR